MQGHDGSNVGELTSQMLQLHLLLRFVYTDASKLHRVHIWEVRSLRATPSELEGSHSALSTADVCVR